MSKPKSKVVTVWAVGPLERYAGQFMRLLADRGYAPLSRVPFAGDDSLEQMDGDASGRSVGADRGAS